MAFKALLIGYLYYFPSSEMNNVTAIYKVEKKAIWG